MAPVKRPHDDAMFMSSFRGDPKATVIASVRGVRVEWDLSTATADVVQCGESSFVSGGAIRTKTPTPSHPVIPYTSRLVLHFRIHSLSYTLLS